MTVKELLEDLNEMELDDNYPVIVNEGWCGVIQYKIDLLESNSNKDDFILKDLLNVINDLPLDLNINQFNGDDEEGLRWYTINDEIPPLEIWICS